MYPLNNLPYIAQYTFDFLLADWHLDDAWFVLWLLCIRILFSKCTFDNIYNKQLIFIIFELFQLTRN